MNAIYILWLRQIIRYWRSKSRIIGSLGQPILFLVALGFGLGPIFEKAGQGNYIYFLAPGVIAQGILFMAVFSGVELIWDRQFGFLKETLVAPVSRFEIMIGRTLGGATIAAVQGLIILILTLFVGFKPSSIEGVFHAFVIMFLISLFYTSVGTTIASLMTDFHGFQLIMNFLIMPTFFLSGAIFPIQTAPSLILTITKINPLSYGVDGLRESLVNIVQFGYWNDVFILSLLSVIFLSIGSYLFTKIEA